MAPLSLKRTQDFANDLSAIGVALGKIGQRGVLGSWQSFTSDQRDQLLNCQVELLRSAATLTAETISLDENDLKSQLDNLREIAASISQTLNRITEVQHIMDIASTSLTLATSAVSGNSTSISTSLDKLLSLLSRSK